MLSCVQCIGSTKNLVPEEEKLVPAMSSPRTISLPLSGLPQAPSLTLSLSLTSPLTKTEEEKCEDCFLFIDTPHLSKQVTRDPQTHTTGRTEDSLPRWGSRGQIT